VDIFDKGLLAFCAITFIGAMFFGSALLDHTWKSEKYRLEWCKKHPTETYHYSTQSFECEYILSKVNNES
jgi:hypothetical protein